ncbi:MAG: hypothetical protein ABIP03_10685, partial [Aquihabitans sp.]
MARLRESGRIVDIGSGESVTMSFDAGTGRFVPLFTEPPFTGPSLDWLDGRDRTNAPRGRAIMAR